MIGLLLSAIIFRDLYVRNQVKVITNIHIFPLFNDAYVINQ
jgi:hypothetical protein